MKCVYAPAYIEEGERERERGGGGGGFTIVRGKRRKREREREGGRGGELLSLGEREGRERGRGREGDSLVPRTYLSKIGEPGDETRRRRGERERERGRV